MATVEDGLELITDIYRIGLSHRNLQVETNLFYQKLEADMMRYRCEVYLNRKREASKQNKKYEDIELLWQYIRETKLMYISACEYCEHMEPCN